MPVQAVRWRAARTARRPRSTAFGSRNSVDRKLASSKAAYSSKASCPASVSGLSSPRSCAVSIIPSSSASHHISAFAESLGEPVGLVEWGSFVGPGWSLFAAQRAPAVRAVASYDPLVIDAASEEEVAQLGEVLDRTGALVAEGRLREAARSFPAAMAEAGFYTEADMAGGATTEFLSASTENIPVFFDELSQAEMGGSPDPADPSQLAEIRVPVLLLHGTRSHPMNVELVRFVGEDLPDSRVRALPGAGHYGPWTHSEAVARELVEFFERVLPPA